MKPRAMAEDIVSIDITNPYIVREAMTGRTTARATAQDAEVNPQTGRVAYARRGRLAS